MFKENNFSLFIFKVIIQKHIAALKEHVKVDLEKRGR